MIKELIDLLTKMQRKDVIITVKGIQYERKKFIVEFRDDNYELLGEGVVEVDADDQKGFYFCGVGYSINQASNDQYEIALRMIHTLNLPIKKTILHLININNVPHIRIYSTKTKLKMGEYEQSISLSRYPD